MAGCDGEPDELLGRLAIAEVVQLEPAKALRRGLLDLLEPNARRGRHRIERVRRRRAPRRRGLSVRMGEPMQGRRREEDRV